MPLSSDHKQQVPELKRGFGRAQLLAHLGVVEGFRLVEQRCHARVGGRALGEARLRVCVRVCERQMKAKPLDEKE